MSPKIIISVVAIYFLALIVIAYFTSRKAKVEDFFIGNRSSPWYLVAFGMIGASLSGVTFISVPGEVGIKGFAYFQLVLGYIFGYAFIAFVLMPIYYKLNLISIYTYLEKRFGFWSYKTGSFFFLLSRTIGAAFRLYLAAEVLQLMIFNYYNIPFEATVIITVGLIWVYTFRGGIKTIVWTDTFQTLFLVGSLILSVITIKNELGWSFNDLFVNVHQSRYSTIFDWNVGSQTFFVKQFLAGIFISIVMTGLDQDLMQKNLTCKNIKEAQTNMVSFVGILIVVNYLFLMLGACLYLYTTAKGIIPPSRTDQLFPTLAFNNLGMVASILFLLGIIASTYASADSALASLTTAFCIDFLNFESKNDEKQKSELKLLVHIAFSILLLFVIIIFKYINDQAVISAVFKAAGLTYGPLLGLFFFGLFTKYQLKDKLVPLVCCLAVVFSYFLNQYSLQLFNGYRIGFELLLINGAFTFLGLLIVKSEKVNSI